MFDVRSADELESAVHEHLRARLLDIRRGSDGIDSHGRMVKAAGSELWFCSYGTLVELSFPESDYLRVQVPLKGSAITTVGQTKHIVTADAACISTATASIRFQPDYCQFAWRVSKSAISEKLAALTGSPVTPKLEFSSELDLSTTQGRLLRSLMGGFASATKLPSASLLCGEIEQAMITVLLNGPLHGSTGLFETKPPALAPRHVRVVEEYIETHWNQPLNYEVLALISNASVRSIFRAFRIFRGYTPMDFARKIRLMHANKMLTAENNSASITSIAANCGYSSLSVFSRDFSKEYHISPSAARGR